MGWGRPTGRRVTNVTNSTLVNSSPSASVHQVAPGVGVLGEDDDATVGPLPLCLLAAGASLWYFEALGQSSVQWGAIRAKGAHRTVYTHLYIYIYINM